MNQTAHSEGGPPGQHENLQSQGVRSRPSVPSVAEVRIYSARFNVTRPRAGRSAATRLHEIARMRFVVIVLIRSTVGNG
jgi:hypothetical protein